MTLTTAGAVVEEEDLSHLRRFLQWLANPNLAFLFMSLGTLGIIYELATPGLGAAGGVGVLLILLALFSLAILPIDAVGLLFLLPAGVLLGVELFAPGIGVAAALGTVALALSGAFLFRESGPGLAVSPAVVLPTVVTVGGAVILAGRLALRARGTPASTGPRALVGRQTVVIRSSGPSGQARVEGSWWNVRAEAPLRPGQPVRIRGVDGLDLLVEPASPSGEVPETMRRAMAGQAEAERGGWHHDRGDRRPQLHGGASDSRRAAAILRHPSGRQRQRQRPGQFVSIL